MTTLPEFDEQLHSVLERARAAGFLGPGPLRVHAASCQAFHVAIENLAGGSGRLVDLGAGGGLPSLPLFHWNTGLTGTLVDTSEKRTSFLRWAVVELNLQDRVVVERARAEEFAHADVERETYDLVVARGFAGPGITLECAAPLLRVDRTLILAGPPGGRDWDEAELADLGLRPGPAFAATSDDGESTVVQTLHRFGTISPKLPRPWRQLSKRPRPVVIE